MFEKNVWKNVWKKCFEKMFWKNNNTKKTFTDRLKGEENNQKKNELKFVHDSTELQAQFKKTYEKNEKIQKKIEKGLHKVFGKKSERTFGKRNAGKHWRKWNLEEKHKHIFAKMKFRKKSTRKYIKRMKFSKKTKNSINSVIEFFEGLKKRK